MVAAIDIVHQAQQQVNQTVGGSAIGRITNAIKTAATRTGVDFAYLLNKAAQESGFDPNAKASTSSATGLFQFTQQTWLQTVKANGAQFGLGQYADHIQVKNGVAEVSDPTWRKAILDLRKAPTVSAEMAGELDKSNFSNLKANVGGTITPTDLYLAHFLGAGGASNFLNTMKANPNASAANILPDAAAANPKVFYDSSGQPRSLSQIYQHFAARFDHAPQLPNAMASTMLADAAPVSPSSSSPSLAAAAQSAIAATESAGIAQGGFTPPVMPQGSFNLASLSGKNLQNAAPQSAGATAAGGANNALPSPSSLFATMMMAQMDTGDITRLPLMSGTAGTNHHKAGAAASADAMA